MYVLIVLFETISASQPTHIVCWLMRVELFNLPHKYKRRIDTRHTHTHGYATASSSSSSTASTSPLCAGNSVQLSRGGSGATAFVGFMCVCVCARAFGSHDFPTGVLGFRLECGAPLVCVCMSMSCWTRALRLPQSVARVKRCTHTREHTHTRIYNIIVSVAHAFHMRREEV